MADFYKKTTPSINYYKSGTTNTEPNMRQELEDTLDGFLPEVAKGQSGLLRKMRRDANGDPIPCDCVDPVTLEPDKDRFCPICFGESYLWDEEDIEFYKVLEGGDTSNVLRDDLTEAGLINIPLVVFYTRYSSDITKVDKLIELELELDGSKSDPLKRKGVYRIETAWAYRADLGKLEYWKIFTHLESVKYLNSPSYEDV